MKMNRKVIKRWLLPLMLAVAVSGCIKNDIPYPRLLGRITAFEVRGQIGEAVIDSIARTVTVDIEDTAVLTRLRLLRFELSDHTSVSPEIDSVIDLSSPKTFSLTTWPDQSYEWTVSATQTVERYIRVLQAVGRNFSGRFSSQLMAPAYPKKVLEHIYKETGLTSYCPNIEVWDKRLFQTLCPGKEQWIGHDEWIRRTVDAVEVFGKGKVCTQVVAGAELARPAGFETVDEALKSNLEGCEFFAKNGVICLSTIWRPHRASRLGYQPMPPLDYYIRLAKGFHEIRRSYGLLSTNDDYKHCGNHPDSDLERLDV